jgi:alkylation response protein AidB-like acyl-CoA dehydrogenase
MGVQIMGGYGLSAEYDMQRYFRDARSATIAAGTSQTQRNLIAGLMGLKAR